MHKHIHVCIPCIDYFGFEQQRFHVVLCCRYTWWIWVYVCVMYELQNEINGCIRNFPNRKTLSRAMAGNRTIFVPSSQLQLELASSILYEWRERTRTEWRWVSEWASEPKKGGGERKILNRVNLSHGMHITHAYPFWRTRHAPSIPNRIAFYNLQKKKCSLHTTP